ncbi:MAG: gamma-glutamyl-gamma-aminobutyrate hydrolase family protein [Mycobacterium sp.]|nr:gamma-glutamyl-gamma-aminobutyrate hydrolase family protein [Mycobacterium sp.]
MTTYLQQVRSGVWDVPASFLAAAYLDGVTRAGGIAMLLPPQPVDDAIADEVVSRIDGLILTGGRDVDPGAYGQRPHPDTEEPARERDSWEFAVLDAALRGRLPVLGICRGPQVINVGLGGTLHQHLPDVIGHSGHRVAAATFATNTAAISGGSRLSRLLGQSVQTRCYHHQAIDRLGRGLIATAVCDGVIEGIEADGEDFLLGVQWHPEENLEDLRLFAGLVAAAGAYATQKAST